MKHIAKRLVLWNNLRGLRPPFFKESSMKLSHDDVELLVLSINPLVELNRECNPERHKQLEALQQRLEVWHETTKQLEGE
jgi:hypothetical protein